MKEIITTIIDKASNQIDNQTLTQVVSLAKTLIDYRPYIGIFGETGNGKSSLCNALFGQKIAAVSHHTSCTRDIQAIPIPQGDAVLLDIPGIAEMGRTDEYLDLYHELSTEGYQLPSGKRVALDLAIWAIPAGSRAYANAQMGVKLLRNNGIPLLVVLTKADDVDEGEWDYQNQCPDPVQLSYLERRRQFASEKLGIPISNIIFTAADQAWNLDNVIQAMLNILPPSKRASVARSIRPQLSTKRVEESVEEGLFDSIGTFIKNNPALLKNIIEIIMSFVFKSNLITKILK